MPPVQPHSQEVQGTMPVSEHGGRGVVVLSLRLAGIAEERGRIAIEAAQADGEATVREAVRCSTNSARVVCETGHS